MPNGFICATHTTWGTPKENIADQGIEVRKEALRKARACQTRDMKLPSLSKGRLSAKHANKQVITCPHCGKSGKKPPMIRWHFDNCPTSLTSFLCNATSYVTDC